MLPQPLLERGEDVGAPRQGCKRPCLFPARGDRAPADPTSTAHPPLRVPSPASAHRSTATRRGTSTPSSLRRAAGSPRSGSGCPLAASWATAGSGRTDRHPASSTHRPPRRCATRRTLSAAFGAAPADLTPTSSSQPPPPGEHTQRRAAVRRCEGPLSAEGHGAPRRARPARGTSPHLTARLRLMMMSSSHGAGCWKRWEHKENMFSFLASSCARKLPFAGRQRPRPKRPGDA